MGHSQLFCKQLSFMALKYLCLTQVSEHCPHSCNHDAAWLWPAGHIKPDLQIPGTRTSCLQELINPRQEVQHAACVPSAEYTGRYMPGSSCLLKRCGRVDPREEFYKRLSVVLALENEVSLNPTHMHIRRCSLKPSPKREKGPYH